MKAALRNATIYWGDFRLDEKRDEVRLMETDAMAA